MKTIYRIFLLALIITTLIFVFIFFFIKLPDVQIYTASKIYDANGRLVDSLYVENRTQVNIHKTPIYLQQAFIAVEDSRFYKHFGIDPIGIFRAVITNFKKGRVVEGGSTITQQLAKNLFLTHERTLKRKIYEALLTLKLELLYSKQEILEMYLNNIYFGHGTYGIEVASKKYFSKSVEDLNLAESALLAGLPRSQIFEGRII
ncbi:MAG TPA: transglycosylase domain-containing protein, partial [Thermoanaerobacterales bacterium]|nr:transglycosylase domain-containing protein [Thermoanaerobacterales bacterium]